MAEKQHPDVVEVEEKTHGTHMNNTLLAMHVDEGHSGKGPEEDKEEMEGGKGRHPSTISIKRLQELLSAILR